MTSAKRTRIRLRPKRRCEIGFTIIEPATMRGTREPATFPAKAGVCACSCGIHWSRQDGTLGAPSTHRSRCSTESAGLKLATDSAYTWMRKWAQVSQPRRIRAWTIPSATLNGVAPVEAAQRRTSRVMVPMRATEASTASGWSSMASWWKSMTPPAFAR